MMIAILIAAIVVALVVFSFLCYKKAPPTQAIVVTGFGLSRPKVVCGRGVFVLPVVQRADRLNMRLLKIDVKTPETGVKTKEGVSRCSGAERRREQRPFCVPRTPEPSVYKK